MRTPKYQWLSNILRERIQNAVYKAGEKLPSEAELIKEFNFSRQTVRQAVSSLEKEGLVETRQGRGSIIMEHRDLKKTNTIGLLVPIIEEYIFPETLRIINGILSAEKYLCFVATTDQRYDTERALLKEFLKKNVDALLIFGVKNLYPNPNIDLYDEFNREGTPLVFMNPPYKDMPYAVSIVEDDFSGAMEVTRLLVHKKHRKINGIFNGQTVSGIERCRGYLAALKEAGLAADDKSICWYNGDDPRQKKIIEDFVRNSHDCSAFVCYNDNVACLVTEILKAEGKKIPTDAAVTGFDDSTFCGADGISITSVHSEGYARLAAEAVLKLINGQHVSSVVMSMRVVEKGSA
jgi:GntR family transcriptional regulator of arabinose operon